MIDTCLMEVSIVGEDTTQDITKKYDTKPTIETVLERINDLAVAIRRMEERIGIRLDRIESEVKLTHSELYALRADFTELRSEFNNFKSQFKEPA
jgi:hypothetical protein